jgi:hypothetical protein
MNKIYCGYCDQYFDKASMEEHVKTERDCQCNICSRMEPGKFCYYCGWCKGSPGKYLNKDAWHIYQI